MKWSLRMKKTVSIPTFIVIGMLIVSACTQQQPAQAGPLTPVVEPPATTVSGGTIDVITPEPPTSTPVDLAAGGQKIVRLDDQGKTMNLAVGEGFLLKLGEGYTWEVSISDQNVLSRVMNIAVVRGAQGVYDAHQAGTVTLSAAGDPECRQSQPPCGMPSILFTITIVVK
jgi:hypothetical protein